MVKGQAREGGFAAAASRGPVSLADCAAVTDAAKRARGMTLIDSHTHLDGFVRSGELPDVLARAAAAGVGQMITIGTEPGDWAMYRDLAAAHPRVVYYSVGLHPCSVGEDWPTAVDTLARWPAEEPAPVAIGETGLDRFHLPRKNAAAAERLFTWQRASFSAHIEIARTRKLPLVVHSRGAAQECIQQIDASGFDWRRVVFHCFTDGPEVMAEINRRGGRGSFTGIATYKSAENVRRAARAQGLDQLMVETDAPYLAPEPLPRKARNEPAFVKHTASALAEIFRITAEDLAAAATKNTREFFGLGQ